jgi:DNA-binding transcriptional LysR family regulator
MSAASFLFVPEIVSSSDLVALVPRRQLRSQADRLVLVDIPWLSEQFDISLIWHERSHGHAGHRWIRDLVVEVAADEGKGVRMPELARAGRATKADRRSG